MVLQHGQHLVVGRAAQGFDRAAADAGRLGLVRGHEQRVALELRAGREHLVDERGDTDRLPIGFGAVLDQLRDLDVEPVVERVAASQPQRHDRERPRLRRDARGRVGIQRTVPRDVQQRLDGFSRARRTQAEDRLVTHVDVGIVEQLQQRFDRLAAGHAADRDRRGRAHVRVRVTQGRQEHRQHAVARARDRSAQGRLGVVARHGRVGERQAVGAQELALVVFPPQPPRVVVGHRERHRLRRVALAGPRRARTAGARTAPAAGRALARRAARWATLGTVGATRAARSAAGRTRVARARVAPAGRAVARRHRVGGTP